MRANEAKLDAKSNVGASAFAPRVSPPHFLLLRKACLIEEHRMDALIPKTIADQEKGHFALIDPVGTERRFGADIGFCNRSGRCQSGILNLSAEQKSQAGTLALARGAAA